MAKRLATKNKKRFKDIAVAYEKGLAKPKHKIAVARSKKAKKKNSNHAY